jgi:hypothetical protein
MNAKTHTLIEKLQRLSPDRQAQVADFVDFLEARHLQDRSEAARRLREAFMQLDAIDEIRLSDEEIQAELDTMCAEKRAQS